MTDLDERLREYSARWRADVPAATVPALPPLRSHRRWILLASAAVVAAVVAGVFWLTRGVGQDPAPQPAAQVGTVPWEPLDPTSPSIPSRRFSDVRVTGNLLLESRPNETVRFAVTLTSPTQVSLDPCPDYTITQTSSFDDKAESHFALNCGAVPYREDGKPYLPAGVPVTFAMETTAGEQSVPLTWALDGGDEAEGSIKVAHAVDPSTSADLKLGETFVGFAIDPLNKTAPPFAPTVRLGLGTEMHDRSATSLTDRAQWVLRPNGQYFAGRVGTFSALKTIADYPDPFGLQVLAGERPRCAGDLVNPPAGVEGLRKITLEPPPDKYESCLDWFSVGLYVDQQGRIAAVTLNLWEP